MLKTSNDTTLSNLQSSHNLFISTFAVASLLPALIGATAKIANNNILFKICIYPELLEGQRLHKGIIHHPAGKVRFRYQSYDFFIYEMVRMK